MDLNKFAAGLKSDISFTENGTMENKMYNCYGRVCRTSTADQ